MELAEFKEAVDAWLDAHGAALAPAFEGIGTLDDQMAQLRKVMRPDIGIALIDLDQSEA